MTSAGTYQALAGVTANVYAPVPQAEVMIVDENAGALGKFVAIRVASQYVSHLGLGEGYLYIGFSHLSQIFVSAGSGSAPFPTTGTGPIGVTGQTGTNNIHLDIMAFFVSATQSRLNPIPRVTVIQGEINLHRNFQAFFRLAGVGNWSQQFDSVEIDPAAIWPTLGDGSVCR